MNVMIRNSLAVLLVTFASPIVLAAAPSGRSTTYPPVAQTMTMSEMKPHLGVIAGLNNPESFKSTPEYGLDVGFQPWAPFGLGFEWSSADTSRQMADTRESLSRNSLLLRGTYNLAGDAAVIRDSYIGLTLGTVIDSRAYKGTHSGIGPVAGFDIPVTDRMDRAQYLTLGLAAKYVFVSGPSPDAFSMNGALKYWF